MREVQKVEGSDTSFYFFIVLVVLIYINYMMTDRKSIDINDIAYWNLEMDEKSSQAFFSHPPYGWLFWYFEKVNFEQNIF